MESCHPSLRAVLLSRDLLPMIVGWLPRHDQGRLWQSCQGLAEMKGRMPMASRMDRIKALVRYLQEKPPGQDNLFGHAGSVEALRLVPKEWLWSMLDNNLPGAADWEQGEGEGGSGDEDEEAIFPTSPVAVFKEELLLPIAALLNCRTYICHLRMAFAASPNAAAPKKDDICRLATEWKPLPCAVYVALCLLDGYLQIHHANAKISLGIRRKHKQCAVRRARPLSFEQIMADCQDQYAKGLQLYGDRSDQTLDYALYHGLIQTVHPMRDFALTVKVMKALSLWHEHTMLHPTLSVSMLLDCAGFYRMSAEDQVHFVSWDILKSWINRDDSANWRTFQNAYLWQQLNDEDSVLLADGCLKIENRLLVESMYIDRLAFMESTGASVYGKKRLPEDMTEHMPLWTERFLNLTLESQSHA